MLLIHQSNYFLTATVTMLMNTVPCRGTKLRKIQSSGCATLEEPDSVAMVVTADISEG